MGYQLVVAPIIGPTLGGWITDNYSWRWIFYINIPIGILAVFMANTFVEDPPYIRNQRPGRIDYLGFGLMALALGTQPAGVKSALTLLGMSIGPCRSPVAAVSPEKLPKMRAAAPDTLLAACGTSCRHQIADAAQRDARHIVRILDEASVGP